MPAVPVRPAVVDDLPVIVAMIHELAEYEKEPDAVVLDVDEVRGHLFGPSPAASVLMAVDDGGSVVGFALYHGTFSTWLGKPGIWLEDLFVRPDARGNGHGKALLAALREMTDGRIEWAVLDWNEPSIRFYESLGARAVAGWTRYRWL